MGTKKVTKKKSSTKKTKKTCKDGSPFGSPTKYKQEFCFQLIDHMTDGFSFESFAGIIGTSIRTVKNWVDEEHESYQKDFLHAKEIGMGYCLKFWESQGIRGLWGNRERSFNASIFIFNMKNRFGWSDRTDLRIEKEKDFDKKDMGLLQDVPRAKLIEIAKKAS